MNKIQNIKVLFWDIDNTLLDFDAGAEDSMKQKPRWTLEMLIAALAVLCALLTLALLVQRRRALC